MSKQQRGCYTPELLARVQQTELEIFDDFDALCEKHGLTYFAFGGSAIGAVRHKGFIPWDDDIDLGMLRKDYERFLEIAEAEYGDKYDIVNAERYPTCSSAHTHWSKKNTLFGERIALDAGYPAGIFLDVFPFDYIPDDERSAQRMARCAWFWNKLYILSLVSEPVLHMENAKKKLITVASKMIHGILCAFRVNPRRLYARYKAISIQYKDEPSRRVGVMHATTPLLMSISTEDLFPLQRVPFEQRVISLPNNVHNMLTRQYGDYMELPPPEKRYNHAPEVICFDTTVDRMESF